VLLSNTMETVSVKLEEEFARTVDKVMKKHHYATKTEFIREAMRDKVVSLEKEELLMRVNKLYGFSKRRTTDEDLHRARERAVAELEKELQ
ncbi:hypothetical protein HY489_05040, partial [Candidatus Woesearchaeota archaeon]|nr:hypothetical protein [Candidatus Woesearchaeota archaeon]